ncbi:MAG TPA: hypothetical protein VNZ66_11105 [Aeromicrobium sp.]|nr:hypothetical protein [Aeromicrobium sp.]
MGRITAIAVTAVTIATVLSGCSISRSPYCQAVEDHQELLSSFDSDRSDAGYTAYARALAAIAAEAPAETQKDWKKLADVTQAVVTAHTEVGFKLEDMDSKSKREGLSAGDIESINAAYKAFNDTVDQRKAVVADADKTCDITLK